LGNCPTPGKIVLALRSSFQASTLPRTKQRSVPTTMVEQDSISEVDQAGAIWTRLVQIVVAVLVVGGTSLLVRFYTPEPTNDLQSQVRQLSQQVQQLKQERTAISRSCTWSSRRPPETLSPFPWQRIPQHPGNW